MLVNVSDLLIRDPFVFVEKDGGHAMIFTGLDKQEYITFHQPNCPPKERMNKFLLSK